MVHIRMLIRGNINAMKTEINNKYGLQSKQLLFYPQPQTTNQVWVKKVNEKLMQKPRTFITWYRRGNSAYGWEKMQRKQQMN